MFNNQRYITRGVADSIEPFCQLLMWDMIDNLKETMIKSSHYAANMV